VCHARAYLNLSLFSTQRHTYVSYVLAVERMGTDPKKTKELSNKIKRNNNHRLFSTTTTTKQQGTQPNFILLRSPISHINLQIRQQLFLFLQKKRIMKFLISSAAFGALLATSSNAFAPATTTTRTSSALFSTRQPIMAGNWKMNPSTEDEALALAGDLTKLLGEETCAIDDSDEMCTEVVIFPPHPFISKVKETVDDAGITVGAQSIFFEDKVRTVYMYTHTKMIIQKGRN
jgi:hypothetical protein